MTKMDFETSYSLYQKDLEDAKKKKDYWKLKSLTANEIVDKIVKGDKDFSNVRIFGIDWARRDLSGFNFSGSKIEWCVFSGCKIKGANFSGAFIDWCLFDSTDLSKSNFKGCIIYDSGFLDANLTDVDFTNGDLRWVLIANITGRPNFTNCIQTSVWYSLEDMIRQSGGSVENFYRYMEKAGLPIPQSLLFKFKINDMISSTEKIKFFYGAGREALNPSGNLNLYNLKRVGKPSLGEYKSEGIYTSKVEYGIKGEYGRKKTNVYKK